MKLEEFNALSDEQKSAFLEGVDNYEKQIDDLTAERDSFKTENETYKTQLDASTKELKATKELNFTLARKINNAPEKDVETQLHDFIKEF